MSNRVTRDGNTVTVRCQYHPDDAVLRLWPGEHGFVAQICIPSHCHCAALSMDEQTLAALGDACHALAGEPDWKALALKLGRLAIPEHLIRTRNLTFEELTRLSGEGNDAYAAITDAEWAALEGDWDDFCG